MIIKIWHHSLYSIFNSPSGFAGTQRKVVWIVSYLCWFQLLIPREPNTFCRQFYSVSDYQCLLFLGCSGVRGWILSFPSKDWLLRGTVIRTGIFGNPISQCWKHFNTQRQPPVKKVLTQKSKYCSSILFLNCSNYGSLISTHAFTHEPTLLHS